MNRSIVRAALIASMAAGLGAVAVGLAGIFSESIAGKADQPPSLPHASVEEAPPPPALSFEFVSPEGRFQVTEWDNRAMSAEAKAKDPSFNPAWNHFGRCLADDGLEVRANPQGQFTQQDMDTLVERVNDESPDGSRNLAAVRGGIGEATGSAKTFLTCAYEWLHRTPKEMYELTGEPNNWYPPQTEPPK